MRRHAARLVSLLAAAATALVLLAPPAPGPPGPSDPRPGSRDSDVPDTGRPAAGGGAPVPPPPASSAAEGVAASRRAPPPRRRPAPEERGALLGCVDLPASLAAARDRVEIAVTYTREVLGGIASESVSLEDALALDGSFELRDLLPGEYTLRITLAGAVVSAPRRVAVLPGRTTRVEIGFERRPCARGRVVSAVDGSPVAGARVGILGEAAETTDARGRFVLWDLEPGEHPLLVLDRRHAPLRAVLEIPDRGEAPFLDLPLVRGARASVRAIDAEGAPVAGVHVQASGEDHVVFARTDAAGVARFEGLEPGALYVVAVAGARGDALAVSLFDVPEEPAEADLVLAR